MSLISKRIIEYLEAKNMTARQMSIAIGKNDGYLSNAFKKGSAISVETISQICQTFGDLNPSYLLTGKGGLILNQDMVAEDGATYETNSGLDKAINERIDRRIDEKLRGSFLSEIVKELIASEIEEELARVQKEKSK